MTPGTYTVQLVSGGNVVDSKPLTLVQDPAIQMDAGGMARYHAIVADLHEAQRRGSEAARPLATLFPAVNAAAPKVDSSSAPAELKAEWATFRKDFDAVRAKFGIGVGGGGFGGGGGAAAQAAQAANVLGRVSLMKGAIMGITEMPSAATMQQAERAKAALAGAVPEVGPIIERARSLRTRLAAHGVTLGGES